MMAVLVAEQGIAGAAKRAAGGAHQPAGQRMLRLDVSLNRVYNSANVLKNAHATDQQDMGEPKRFFPDPKPTFQFISVPDSVPDPEPVSCPT